MCLFLSKCSAKIVSNAGVPSASPIPKINCVIINWPIFVMTLMYNQQLALIKYPPANKSLLCLNPSPSLEITKVNIVVESRNADQEILIGNIPTFKFSTYNAYKGPSKLPAKTKIPLYKNNTFNTLLGMRIVYIYSY